MLVNGAPVEHLDGREGYVHHYMHAHDGSCYWLIGWDDGTTEVVPESSLIDIECQEYRRALYENIPDEARCTSYYYRRCALPAGHRTRMHRSCEVSWDDTVAFFPPVRTRRGTGEVIGRSYSNGPGPDWGTVK